MREELLLYHQLPLIPHNLSYVNNRSNIWLLTHNDKIKLTPETIT